MDMSQFKFYSIGIVATNKLLTEKTVEIYPIEILPFLDGEISDSFNEIMAKGIDASNKEYEINAIITNSLVAEWLQFGSNRLTAPDVRRGERVFIWRYGNNDKFYWSSMGLDDNLRKLETVVWTFSDTPDESKEEINEETVYSLEVSTHTKQITLKTAKGNGEPYTYVLQFNTGEGVVTLADDDGQLIELNSDKKRITLENHFETLVQLDKKIINVYAPDTINMEAVNTINVKATTINVDATDINVKADSINVESNSIDINTNTMNAIGQTSISFTVGASTLSLSPASINIKTPALIGST